MLAIAFSTIEGIPFTGWKQFKHLIYRQSFVIHSQRTCDANRHWWYFPSLVGGEKSISFAAATIDLSCGMYLYCHLSPAPCMTGTPRWAKRPAERWRCVYPRIGDPLQSSLWSRIKEALRQTACQSLCWINCGILEDCVSHSLKLFSLVGEANSLNDFCSIAQGYI